MNKKMSVYVVDDNNEGCNRMKDELRKSERFEVVGSASNGEQCLKKHMEICVLITTGTSVFTDPFIR